MTADADVMKSCKMCGKDFADLPQSGRCNERKSLKTRLCRQFKKNAGDERRQWESLTNEQRQVFYSQWHGEVGIDLKAAISEKMVESLTESKHETSTISCSWLDEVQLREKYKGKEEPIEKIKKCPVDGVQYP